MLGPGTGLGERFVKCFLRLNGCFSGISFAIFGLMGLNSFQIGSKFVEIGSKLFGKWVLKSRYAQRTMCLACSSAWCPGRFFDCGGWEQPFFVFGLLFCVFLVYLGF